VHSIGSSNRYSVAVSGQPNIDPVIPGARVANIANLLTGVRLVLVPVFLLALFVGDGHETVWRIVAFVIFAVGSTVRWREATGLRPTSASWPIRSRTRRWSARRWSACRCSATCHGG
jgi:hypothetical protein